MSDFENIPQSELSPFEQGNPYAQPASTVQPSGENPFEQGNPYAQASAQPTQRVQPDPYAQPQPSQQAAPNPYAQPQQAQAQPNPYAQPAQPSNPYAKPQVQQANPYSPAPMQQGTMQSDASNFNGARSGVIHSNSFGNNAPVTQGTPTDTKAIVSIVCGILGIIGSWIPILKYITVLATIVSIIFGILAVKGAQTSKGAAIAGLVLGGVGLLMFIGGIVVSIAFTNMVVDSFVGAFS